MTKPKLLVELSIDDWVQGLSRFSPKEFTPQNVQHYIREHAILPASLEPYIFFSPRHYTRNLVFKNEVFECLTIGWEVGQSSPIHGHNDKIGYMLLTSGRLFVQNYRLEDRDPVNRTCCVVPTEGAELGRNNRAEVDSERGVHKVCNLPRFQQRAVSVHLYQRPMSQCEVYHPQEGTFEEVSLGYTSEYGRVNPEVRL